MNLLLVCLIMQVCLAFGVAALVWPEKLMPLFGVLMFPWQANHRVIRANGLLLVGAYAALLTRLVMAGI